MKRRHAAAMFAALVAWSQFSAVGAQEPVKLSRVVVPYGPGGGVDAFARPVATVLGENQNFRVVVDNKSGAGGTIGVLNAAQAPADGSTMLAGGVHQPMAEALYLKRGYKIDVDFIPVVITASVPNVLVVPVNSRFDSVAAIMAEAKANPGKLTYCSSGNGTSQHIVAEMFMRETKLNIVHVPYRGTAAALPDLIAGVCDMMFDGLGTSGPLIEAKRLKPLAVTTAARSPYLPEVKTMKEAGGPPMDVSTWYALWVPKDTPDAAVARLREQVRTALQAPTIKKVWEQQGALVPAISDAQIVKFVQDETALWTKTVTDLNIRSD